MPFVIFVAVIFHFLVLVSSLPVDEVIVKDEPQKRFLEFENILAQKKVVKIGVEVGNGVGVQVGNGCQGSKCYTQTNIEETDIQGIGESLANNDNMYFPSDVRRKWGKGKEKKVKPPKKPKNHEKWMDGEVATEEEKAEDKEDKKKTEKEEEKKRKEEEKKMKDEEKRRKDEEKKNGKKGEKKGEEKDEKGHKKKGRKYNDYYKITKLLHGGDEEFWKMEEDKKEKHYPKHLKEKVAKGEIIKQFEEDKFENEFGRYYERNGTTVLDIITSVNTGNDVTDVDEGDLVMSGPGFDFRNFGGLSNEGDCDKKGGKGKKKCHPHGKPKKMHKRELWEDRKRDARRDRVYLWINRIVPYQIDSELGESAVVIRDALQLIQEKTCITFKEYKDEENWIVFVKKTGCWSSVGRKFWSSGPQEISLGNNCAYHGIVIHEVMHALGFWHEQSRPDRDRYVEIFWENIMDDEIHNFNKYGENIADRLTAPYDFGSIMHYGEYSFASDAQKPTIKSLSTPNATLGQRDGLSSIDIFQINLLYDCATTGEGWSRWSEYGPCDTSCIKERTRFCMDKNDRMACPGALSTELIYWGVDVQKAVCANVECYAPVSGHWNKWGSWGDCSVTCDTGSHSRTRKCDDPAPANGGNFCVGRDTETRACLSRKCSSGPFDCEFDFDSEPQCSWTVDSSADLKWLRNSGGTPSSSTGPDKDHTSGSGYYLFIESSSPAQLGSKARLISQQMSAGPRCFKFSYHMYGLSTGDLNVYVKDTVTNGTEKVFSKSGDHFKSWYDAKIEVTSSNPYQVFLVSSPARR